MSYLSDLLGDAFKEGMTEEEISAALEAKQNEEQSKRTAELSAKDAEIATLKSQMQKANSEAAKFKKELNSYKTDDEKKKEEQETEMSALRDEVATLKREKSISELKASYVGMGYAEELALDTATAMVNGDMAKVLENQKTFNSTLENSVKANLSKNIPGPNNGGDGKTITHEDIRKMSNKEKLAFYQQNPDAYRAAYEEK